MRNWPFSTASPHLRGARLLKLREMLASNKELAHRLAQLEARLEKRLTDHDEAIAAILSAIRQLMSPPATKRRGIGFTADIEK